jgi:hypothetical protein
MAIGADSTVYFYGTQDSVDDGSTSAITTGNFSAAADITSWTNDDDAPLADMVLLWQYPSGTISAGAVVNVYAQLLNIQSTNDENVVDASNTKHLLGSFRVDEGLAATTNEYAGLKDVKLPSFATSQIIDFYFENQTGVSMSASWAVWITPKTLGPHA